MFAIFSNKPDMLFLYYMLCIHTEYRAFIIRHVMIDDFETHVVRSSGDLWSEVCSSLPQPQELNDGQFTDSFQPSSQESPQPNSPRASLNPWEPMADSEVYIASLGTENMTFDN